MLCSALMITYYAQSEHEPTQSRDYGAQYHRLMKIPKYLLIWTKVVFIRRIDLTYARSRIRSIVELIGVAMLGFTKENIGLHFILCSGGAMAMFLLRVVPYNYPMCGLLGK